MSGSLVRVKPAELRRLSLLAGYHSAAFARAVGISESHLSRIFSGQASASPGALKRMADTLECDVTDIADLIEQPAEAAS